MRSPIFAILAAIQLVVIAVLLWYIGSRSPGPASAGAESRSAEFGRQSIAPAQMASELTVRSVPTTKPSLAVLPFSIDAGIPELAGASLADALQGEIDPNLYVLYDRTSLGKLLENSRLEQTDLFDHNTQSVQLAKLAQVECVLIGSVSRPARGSFQFTAKILEITGHVRVSESVLSNRLQDTQRTLHELAVKMGVGKNRPPGDLPSPPPPFNDLRDACNPNAFFNVNLWTQNHRKHFDDGEKLQLTVRAKARCFLTIITWDPNGNPTLLMPNEWNRVGLVEADTDLTIPPKDAEYELPVQAPHGRTLIKVIATTAPLQLTGVTAKDITGHTMPLPPTVKAIGLAAKPPPTPVKVDACGDVSVLLGLDPTTWATADLTITTHE